MAFRIVALDHVHLAMPVGQESEAEAFYRDVLGFEEPMTAGFNEQGAGIECTVIHEEGCHGKGTNLKRNAIREEPSRAEVDPGGR